jgi:hypothetical protein
MGAWSAEPFGNDDAADWAWELDDAQDWDIVREAFDAVADPEDGDEGAEAIAVAAAEVVAHGLGRPTQSDSYTESVTDFVARVGAPPDDLPSRAVEALNAVTTSGGALRELWEDDAEWLSRTTEVRQAIEQE